MPGHAAEDESLDPTRIAVLGAGHAGRGLAGYLSIRGMDVALFNRSFQNIRAISEKRGIKVRGLINAFAEIPLITSDIAEATKHRDILIITVPAQAHPFFARILKPHLESGQTVLLMPGRTGGALEFERILKSGSFSKDILIGEAQTFSFVSRNTDPESVLISKIKKRVDVCAFPATRNSLFIRSIRRLPLRFKMADDILWTGFSNFGAMLHPTPTILSAGLLESRCGGYDHYHDAISTTVGRLIERMDAERIRIAQEYDTYPVSLLEWLRETYGACGDTLCECIDSIDAYDGVGCPSTLNHRYVLEDIPTGLVPISYFGKLAGIESPIIDTVVDMACELYEHDFWSNGRTLESLGIEGLSPPEVQEYATTGIIFDEYPVDQPMQDTFGLEVDRS
jgi:opine dehydrogenase